MFFILLNKWKLILVGLTDYNRIAQFVLFKVYFELNHNIFEL